MHAGYGNVKSSVKKVGDVQHMAGTYTRRIMKIRRVDEVPYTGTLENPQIKSNKCSGLLETLFQSDIYKTSFL